MTRLIPQYQYGTCAEPFWMVYAPQGGPPRVEHPTAEAAKAEATRLAALYPGRQFFVLKTTDVFAVFNPIHHASL